MEYLTKFMGFVSRLTSADHEQQVRILIAKDSNTLDNSDDAGIVSGSIERWHSGVGQWVEIFPYSTSHKNMP